MPIVFIHSYTERSFNFSSYHMGLATSYGVKSIVWIQENTKSHMTNYLFSVFLFLLLCLA